TKKVEIPAELRPVIATAAKNLATHLYGPEGPPWGTSSFASLEELAVLISRQLGSELLQQALQRQANQPPPAQLQSCPVAIVPLRADHLSDDAPLEQFFQQRQANATGQRPYRCVG